MPYKLKIKLLQSQAILALPSSSVRRGLYRAENNKWYQQGRWGLSLLFLGGSTDWLDTSPHITLFSPRLSEDLPCPRH